MKEFTHRIQMRLCDSRFAYVHTKLHFTLLNDHHPHNNHFICCSSFNKNKEKKVKLNRFNTTKNKGNDFSLLFFVIIIIFTSETSVCMCMDAKEERRKPII